MARVDQYTPLYKIYDGKPRPTLEQSQANIEQLLKHYPYSEYRNNDYHIFLLQAREVNHALANGMRLSWHVSHAWECFGLLRSIAITYEDEVKFYKFKEDYDILLHHVSRAAFESANRTALEPLGAPEGKGGFDPDWEEILDQVTLGGHRHVWDKTGMPYYFCDFCDVSFEEYLENQHYPSLRERDWYIERTSDIKVPLQNLELVRVYDAHPDTGGILRLLLHVNDEQVRWEHKEIVQLMRTALTWKQSPDYWHPAYWVVRKGLYDQEISYALYWYYAVNWPGYSDVASYDSVEAFVEDWNWGLANKRVPLPKRSY